MGKMRRRAYTAQFRELAIMRVNVGGSIAGVSRELGLPDRTLRRWVEAAKRNKPSCRVTEPAGPELMELSRVQAENARLRLENEILKWVTAYLAKDVI
jgi:transposase